MSEEEETTLQTEDGQMLTAEYKDGQLQIVEVTPFDKQGETHILPDLNSQDGEQTKYIQVYDPSKGLVQLDLLNFTLVKCSNEDGDDSSYQVVGTSTSDDGDTTLTCVLANDDAEDDNDNQDSYVMVNTEDGQDPVVFLQSSLQQINQQKSDKQEPEKSNKALTPTEILEKAKALQKAKALLKTDNTTHTSGHGRKRKSDLPPPMELLSSPGFKLYLYSCKQCPFKCNAIKEMSKHKAEEHASGKSRGGGGRSAGASQLQCARCPFRGSTHAQLMKHVQDAHLLVAESTTNTVSVDTAGVDVLVCGACGFQSADRQLFKSHIEVKHGVTVILDDGNLSTNED